MTDGRSAPTARYPWLAIVLACVLAAAATTALFFYSRAQIYQTRAAARSLQRGRLAQSALVLDDYLGDSVHLADAIADVAGPIRGNDRVTSSMLKGFFKSVRDSAIFGLGIFFEPYRYDPRTRLYGPYVDRRQAKIEFYPSSPQYEYTEKYWYKLGRTTVHTIFTHPYFEDKLTYLSAVRPIFDGSTFAGVVTVDSLPKHVIDLMSQPLRPGDVAFVTDDSGQVVLSNAPAVPAAMPRTELTVPLRWGRWVLHLSTDDSAVQAQIRAILTTALAGAAGIWIVTFGALLLSTRAWQARAKQAALEREIAEHITVEERLRESAYHDSLTGLPNREYMTQELAKVLEAKRERPGSAFAVLFIDIDRFSMVNDSLGHGAGDALLRLIAVRLQSALPEGTFLARLGGDEFTALLPLERDDVGGAISVAQELLARIHEPFTLNDGELYSGASIGIVMSDSRYTTPSELLRDADISMYQAKKAGRGRYAIFDEAMHERARELLVMESDLRRAVAHHEFVPYYQPIVDIADGRLVSMEALVRWERADGRVLSAADFIVTAEQMGVLGAIDAMMLSRACAQTHRIGQEIGEPIEVSVNVSATHLTRTDIVGTILEALETSKLPPNLLKLEITETAIMENADEALGVLNRLRDLNISVVVDDFGTGYSSLSYLRRLPISGLKIDRSFVTPIETDPQSAAIVRSIVALAKTLALKVTAEGVETSGQLGLLLECGVDYAQGFYFAEALGAAEMQHFIKGSLVARGVP